MAAPDLARRAAPGRPRPPAGPAGPSPALARRRRLVFAALALLGLGIGWFQLHQAMPGWYARLWYPLDHEETIVREAQRQDLEPALVAAVIYTESGFVPDSRSGEGAVGLMQMLPSTAEFVATLPGRPSPPPDQLERPAANIAYGTRYLRYLLDRHDGDVPTALAAYNGGESNMAAWARQAVARGERFRVPEDIPFTETRRFVGKVLGAREIYRRAYGGRLGG